MFGRLPWLALLRRSLAFFLLVFFDIGTPVYDCDRETPTVGTGRFAPEAPQRAAAQLSNSSADQVLTIRSIGTSRSAARLQP